MGGFEKSEQNVYCSPNTLQIIDTKSLKFSSLKGKITFCQKLHFLYFLAFGVRGVRESC
jgi:hypothetical protein